MPLQKIPHPARPAGRARSLAERTAVIRLCDAYAGLLTGRQQQLLRMYYQEDLSLGEIAAGLRVSRQAVFDGLRRAMGEMRRLEDRLGVLAAAGRNGRTRPAEGRRPGKGSPPGEKVGPRRRDAAAARLSRVEQEAARLTKVGAATGPLLRALRALRAVMPVS
jgi:predicted DNA-binding protein YlxM (UPF0122 family)